MTCPCRSCSACAGGRCRSRSTASPSGPSTTHSKLERPALISYPLGWTFCHHIRPPDPWPRHNPVASTLAASRADQGYDYRAAFCYQYDRLSFAGQTPEQFHRARLGLGTAAQCDASGACLGLELGDDVFVGVVVPRVAANSIIRFNLCSEGACVPAGSTATFGAGKAAAVTGPVSSSTHKLVEVDVTHVVKEQEWFESVLEGRLVESVFEGLPPPVVIMRAEDEPSGGQVYLALAQFTHALTLQPRWPCPQSRPCGTETCWSATKWTTSKWARFRPWLPVHRLYIMQFISCNKSIYNLQELLQTSCRAIR